jgi:hypothetical protein
MAFRNLTTIITPYAVNDVILSLGNPNILNKFLIFVWFSMKIDRYIPCML